MFKLTVCSLHTPYCIDSLSRIVIVKFQKSMNQYNKRNYKLAAAKQEFYILASWG
jgi:hypothetical protein